MAISNLVASSIPNVLSFRNLALLICHLFMDGQFWSGHLLYDPSIFNDHLTVEIRLICPHPIPWKMTNAMLDLTSPWDGRSDTTDNVLQLIFFDPKNLTVQMESHSIYFTFYRIFVLPQTDDIETEEQFSIIKQFNLDSNALIVHYDKSDSEVFINWLPMNDLNPGEWQPTPMITDSQTKLINHTNIFEQTFGEYENRRLIEINIICRKNPDGTPFHLPLYERVRMGYYHQNLSTSYIHLKLAYDSWPFYTWGESYFTETKNKELLFIEDDAL